MNTENISVSIIIPTYNRLPVLKQTLEQIFYKLDFPKEKYEVLVVNDGDPIEAGIFDEFRDFGFRIIKNQKKGAASARNSGAREAGGEYLLFIDDDILISSDHIEKHLDAQHLHPSAIVTSNRLEFDSLTEELKKSVFGRYKLKYDYVWHINNQIDKIDERFILMDGLATFSCFMKKTDFFEIGQFNDDFLFAGSEDIEFFERAKLKDYRLIYDTKNDCYHNEPFNKDSDKWFWRHYSGTASFLQLCSKFEKFKEQNRYYLYTPIKKKDSFKTIRFKILANFASNKMIHSGVKSFIRFSEKIRITDRIIFRMYNFVYIGNWKKGMSDFSKKLGIEL